jgi:hypothetical protein
MLRMVCRGQRGGEEVGEASVVPRDRRPSPVAPFRERSPGEQQAAIARSPKRGLNRPDARFTGMATAVLQLPVPSARRRAWSR